MFTLIRFAPSRTGYLSNTVEIITGGSRIEIAK